MEAAETMEAVIMRTRLTAGAKTSRRRVTAAGELAQTWRQIERPHPAGRYKTIDIVDFVKGDVLSS
ncbi:hypothetical protein T07_5079 [Trichinella nelsoni]|uniref:Uncharacterized protein n=1 Tax=Trichinella nelsoni TaxID=6336 RepID=A0A0V0RG33_9BILA|nr:hypothetical protein T07_5079 [Trichinella nelsoni]